MSKSEKIIKSDIWAYPLPVVVTNLYTRGKSDGVVVGGENGIVEMIMS